MIADTVKQITDLAERLATLPVRGMTITADQIFGPLAMPDHIVIRSGGKLRMLAGLWRPQTVIVLPGPELTIDAGVEIVFPDVPIDPAIDPYGWGNGLIVLGKLTAVGTGKSMPFLRLGDSFPADWRDGDDFLYPDSRMLRPNERFINYRAKWEVVRRGLPEFAHPKSTNGEFQPHIANLTRDIVFRSENPSGNRAHIWFGHRAEINVQHCEFRSTGRTTVADVRNAYDTDPAKKAAGLAKLGRYPVHFHHLWGPRLSSLGIIPAGGPAPQFTFNGNTVWCELDPEVCEFPWGVVLHDSHFGEVTGNVVHNWHGFGIGCLNGNEYGNLIEGNLASGIHGDYNPRDLQGLDASGFWFRGTYS